MTGRAARILLLAAGLWGLAAVPALGHATLVETEPADGEVLESGPSRVSLRFDEPVSAAQGGVRVYDSEGSRVDVGASGGEGTEISAELAAGAADETYVVTWRVVSADGHPLRGAFVFTVGTGEAPDDSFISALLDQGSGRPWRVAGTVAGWLGYLGSVVVAGGMLFRISVSRLGSERIMLRAATAGLVGSIATLFLHGAEATGLGWEALFDPDVLARAAAGPVGLSSLVRAFALGGFLVLGLARRPIPVWPGLAGGAVALGSFLLTGHTLTSEPAEVRVAADIGHLVGVAGWAGGLVMLWSAVRSSPESGSTARIVARFSSLAVWLVVLLAAAGLALAWVEVRAFRAVATPYGWTLVAKTAVVVAVLAVAAYNRRRLVPTVITDPDAPSAWARLRRTLTFEVGGVAVVLAVTALLVGLQPAREVAGVAGPASVYQPVGDEGWQANVVVDPNRAGTNEIHIYLLSGAGRPLDAPSDLTLELAMPAQDIGPLVREPEPAGPAHWILTGPELAIPGEWELTLRLKPSEMDELRSSVLVHVNP